MIPHPRKKATADHGNALMSQESLPLQQTNQQDKSIGLEKLDSKIVETKDEEDPFKHLPDHEKEILKRQVDIPDVKVGYFTLYRYATKMDILIIIISTICTIAAGVGIPLMTVRLEITHSALTYPNADICRLRLAT